MEGPGDPDGSYRIQPVGILNDPEFDGVYFFLFNPPLEGQMIDNGADMVRPVPVYLILHKKHVIQPAPLFFITVI